MVKKQQKNKKIFIILIILIALITGIMFLIKTFYIPTKTYRSEILQITFNYPTKFELEERLPSIILKKKGIDGFIIIDRISTNNTSLTYDSNEQKIIINGMEAKKYTATYSDYGDSLPVEHKGYQIYADHAIYSIYTNTPIFYPDLDQIVKSLHYEP